MAEVVFRQRVLHFLKSDSHEFLTEVDEERWKRNMRWLDRSGLALPLATRLEALRSVTMVPASIRAELQSRLRDNQKRMERMLAYFGETSHALETARVRHCCAKGFSLIPDCFGSIRERHQVDLDFLVAPDDLSAACRALEKLGYCAQHSNQSGELRLVKPWKKHIGVGGYLYQLPEPPPVELHTGFWEPEKDGVELPPLIIASHLTEIHEIAGVYFSRPQPAYQFVYLLLHVFRHLLSSWVRLLSLYEVAAFIRTRSGEGHLWSDVKRLVEQDVRLSSACALVLGLVDFAFTPEFPRDLRELFAGNLSSDSAFWIDRWSAAWLLTDPPGNKLNLLVQKQFWTDDGVWRRYLRRRLFPIRRPHRFSDDVAGSGRRTLLYRAENAWYQASRAWYHVTSGCTYLPALWRWNRSKQRRPDLIYRPIDGL